MRLQGKITRWDDEKGFGFITLHGDGSTTFVHIKDFTFKSRRPAVGDEVTYEVAKGKGDKTRAKSVRFPGQKKQKKNAVRSRKDSAAPVVFAALFIGFLLIATLLNRLHWLVAAFYLVASLVTFIAYAWDKHSAKAGKWRTPEVNLHTMAIMGGWLGALAGQRLLRHKSRKKEFLVTFWITVLLNVVAIGYIVLSDKADALRQLLVNFF